MFCHVSIPEPPFFEPPLTCGHSVILRSAPAHQNSDATLIYNFRLGGSSMVTSRTGDFYEQHGQQSGTPLCYESLLFACLVCISSHLLTGLFFSRSNFLGFTMSVATVVVLGNIMLHRFQVCIIISCYVSSQAFLVCGRSEAIQHDHELIQIWVGLLSPTTAMQSELDKDTNASSPASGNAAKEQYLTTQVRLDEAVMHTRMTVS